MFKTDLPIVRRYRFLFEIPVKCVVFGQENFIIGFMMRYFIDFCSYFVLRDFTTVIACTISDTYWISVIIF